MTENSRPYDDAADVAPHEFTRSNEAGNPLSGQQAGASTDKWGGPAADQSTGGTDSGAAEVMQSAGDSVQHVAETAKAESAHVLSEAKESASDLFAKARTDVTEQAKTQQARVVEGLKSLSNELGSMADGVEQPGMASDMVRRVADKSAAWASWLDGREPGSVLQEVKTFARQKPGTFLLLAAGTGILAGRLTRGLSAGAPDTSSASHQTPEASTPSALNGSPGMPAGGAVPPPAVELPGPAVTTAAATTETFGYTEPVVPDPQRVDPWDEDQDRNDPLRGGLR